MRSPTSVKAGAKSATKTGTKSEETRERILRAALDLFQEGSFDSTTMRDIAVKAGVATGAAYYYYDSKDALVLAFYEKAVAELAPLLDAALERAGSDLKKRVAALLDVKLRYFELTRGLLRTLAAHVDPEKPLSPFSESTRSIREQDIEYFERAITGSKTKVPADLMSALPRLFWLYQMGVILYWIHDHSPAQQRTAALIDKSLGIVVKLVQLSGLPFMSPLRKQALDLYRLAAE